MCVRSCDGHGIYAYQLMRLRIYISTLLIPFFMNTTFDSSHEFDDILLLAFCFSFHHPPTHTKKTDFRRFLHYYMREIYIVWEENCFGKLYRQHAVSLYLVYIIITTSKHHHMPYDEPSFPLKCVMVRDRMMRCRPQKIEYSTLSKILMSVE